MRANPIDQFSQWLKEAHRAKTIPDATAMCLSTVDTDGYPDGRMVLLKSFDERGFVFYTNLESVKGQAIKASGKAALTFYWAPLERQVRLLGRTEQVSREEADAYWVTRPRTTQLGAWASHQSDELSNRAILLKDVAKLALRYGTGPVPRPPHWTGIRVIPRQIEFWQGRASRLHDRLLYTQKNNRWTTARLYP